MVGVAEGGAGGGGHNPAELRSLPKALMGALVC